MPLELVTQQHFLCSLQLALPSSVLITESVISQSGRMVKMQLNVKRVESGEENILCLLVCMTALCLAHSLSVAALPLDHTFIGSSNDQRH